MSKEPMEDKLSKLDRIIRKPFWGVILRIPKVAIYRVQTALGISEIDAIHFIVGRYANIDINKMPDSLHMSHSVDFTSQTFLLCITSTEEREGLFEIGFNCEYPHKNLFWCVSDAQI